MVIFHSYVSLPEGKHGGEVAQQTERLSQGDRRISTLEG